MRLFPSTITAVAIAVLPVLFAACGNNSPTAPTPTAPYSQADLTVGTGAEATTGSNVTVNYTGWLYDASKVDQKGMQFDSSAGRSPLSFTLGVGQVIAGWDKGVVGMKVGGTRRLVIPPSLAYGQVRAGVIPPNTTLVFDIEMLSVE